MDAKRGSILGSQRRLGEESEALYRPVQGGAPHPLAQGEALFRLVRGEAVSVEADERLLVGCEDQGQQAALESQGESCFTV